MQIELKTFNAILKPFSDGWSENVYSPIIFLFQIQHPAPSFPEVTKKI